VCFKFDVCMPIFLHIAVSVRGIMSKNVVV
jgi:hypothetical protein